MPALSSDLLMSNFAFISDREELFADVFYCKLFVRYPRIQRIFVNVAAARGETMEQSMPRQRRALMSTIRVVLELLLRDDVASVTIAARQLGNRHTTYGVSLDDFAPVGECLVSTFREFLGHAWTAHMEHAWNEAYTTLTALMTTPTR